MSSIKGFKDTNLSNLRLDKKTFINPYLISVESVGLTAAEVSVDGLLIEDSKLETNSIRFFKGTNVIIGPGTTINNTYLTHSVLRHAHAVLGSLINNIICHRCIFMNGSFTKSVIMKGVFVDTVFAGCTFNKTVFKECSFSGCLFINCYFLQEHPQAQSIFFQDSSFLPDSVFGHMYSQANLWPHMKQIPVKTNFFIHNSGSPGLDNCRGYRNVSSDGREYKKLWTGPKPPKEIGPTHGNGVFARAYQTWWADDNLRPKNGVRGATNRASQPVLPGGQSMGALTNQTSRAAPVKPPQPVDKHKSRPFRFTTQGLR